MRRILAGVETEYGLLVEDRGAENQVDDAMALVRGYPGECLALWDYRYESPRADLRGFQLDRLAVDPIDELFDEGKNWSSPQDVRSDRVLPNGARFYNDHGHPEYATPECISLDSLARADRFGEGVVLEAARALSLELGRPVSIYKNNTDFHGASYGAHESYCVPREVGFDRLYAAVMPMLVARQILTGAGKVGSESGAWCDFQISQRADFFSESANAETLFRRPVFNTRDEAHADPKRWIRLHVISGDANMMPACTARKVGLVKLALHLAEAGAAPKWAIKNPVTSFQDISRDPNYAFKVQLEGRNWTTAYEILESYFSAAEAVLDLDDELAALIEECRNLMNDLRDPERWDDFAAKVDWAAKKRMISNFLDEEGGDWKGAHARAFDLEYHNVDPTEGLYHALVEMEMVEPPLTAISESSETRATVRGLACTKFRDHIRNVCWRTITLEVEGRVVEIELEPDMMIPGHLREAPDVGTFVRMLRGEQ
jgi:hypothetical protein